MIMDKIEAVYLFIVSIFYVETIITKKETVSIYSVSSLWLCLDGRKEIGRKEVERKKLSGKK